MTDAAALALEIDGVRSADRLSTGTFVELYAADRSDRAVWLYVLSASVTADVRQAFTSEVAGWAGAAKEEPTVRARGTEPHPWVAVDPVEGRRLDTTTPLPIPEARRVIADVAEMLRSPPGRSLYGLTPRECRLVGSPPRGRIEWPLDWVCRAVAGDVPRTPYIAPELRADPDDADERSLVYTLGAIAYETVTGEPPVEPAARDSTTTGVTPTPASNVAPELPADVGEVVRRALSPAPADRFASPYEFSIALLFGDGGSSGASREHAGHQPAAPRGGSGQDGTGLTRRAVLAGAAGLGTAGGTLAVLGRSGSVSGERFGPIEEAPMFQYDPGNTGYTATERAPRGQVRIEWQFRTGGVVTSSPAVLDGTLYVGSHDGRLYALNASDGTELWNYETGDRIESSPAIQDVEVAGQTKRSVLVASRDQHVYALDASDGSERWRTRAGGIPSSPTVVDLAPRGAAMPTVYVGSFDGTVYALRGTDGSDRWAFEAGGPVVSTPAVARLQGGTVGVFVGRSDGRIYALDGQTGAELWRHSTGTQVTASPVVARIPDLEGQEGSDRLVYLGGHDGSLRALDAGTGRRQWQADLGSPITDSPAVAEGTVYVGGSDGPMVALEGVDGTGRWQVDTVISSGVPPVVTDQTADADEGDASTVPAVHVGAADATLHSLEGSDGTERWHVPTGELVRSSPTIVDGTVFLGSDDNSVYALVEEESPSVY